MSAVCLNIGMNKFPLGNKLSLDEKAQVLDAVMSSTCGVRDIVQILRRRTSSVISLLKEMEEEGLVEQRSSKNSSRGRPKKSIVCTRLGAEFWEIHRKLRVTPLRARKHDLERAEKDALYTKRLVALGHSPFKLFLELNSVVHNIEVSSEASQGTR